MTSSKCCNLSCWQKRNKADRLCSIGAVAIIAVLVVSLITIITFYELGLAYTCRSPECVQQASRTMAMMDRSANPCTDFYQYACGSYLADESKRDKSFYIEQINQLNDLVKVLLTENIKYREPRFLSFPKMLYKFCMDQEKIIKDGVKPINRYMFRFGGWPVTLGENWSESSFNWTKMVKKFRENGFPFGFLLQVTDIEEEGAKLLFRHGITHPDLLNGTIPNEQVFLSYTQSLVNIAIRFGADKADAEKEMLKVIEFELKLAVRKVLFLWVDSKNSTHRQATEENQQVERITMKNLQNRYPYINWLIFVRSCLGLNVQNNEIVLIVPSYLEQLGNLLNSTPPRVVANFMMAKLHMFIIEILPGVKPQPYEERQKLCIDLIRSNLWVPIATLYQKRFFDQNIPNGVKQIQSLVGKEFENAILNAKWLNKNSKTIALKKLAAMEVQIAYPVEMQDMKKLDNFHGDLGGSSALGVWKWIDDFFTGVLNSLQKTIHIVSDWSGGQYKISTKGSIQKPKEPIDQSAKVQNEIAKKIDQRNVVSKYNYRNMGKDAHWLSVSDQMQVRAKFEPEYNTLDIRAGILRDGFYHAKLPQYVNFGAIGSILGHEIVHAVDSKGKSFDESGRLRNSWRQKSDKIYQAKFQCLVNQYNSYFEPLTGRQVNGSATLEENIADNIGVAVAYKAYLNWVSRYGRDPSLPGLTLSSKQLFWIVFAQTKCANPSVEKVNQQLDRSETAPERFRVIGSLSNNDDFAKDFECPVDSPMNPAKKCSPL